MLWFIKLLLVSLRVRTLQLFSWIVHGPEGAEPKEKKMALVQRTNCMFSGKLEYFAPGTSPLARWVCYVEILCCCLLWFWVRNKSMRPGGCATEETVCFNGFVGTWFSCLKWFVLYGPVQGPATLGGFGESFYQLPSTVSLVLKYKILVMITCK